MTFYDVFEGDFFPFKMIDLVSQSVLFSHLHGLVARGISEAQNLRKNRQLMAGGSRVSKPDSRHVTREFCYLALRVAERIKGITWSQGLIFTLCNVILGLY